MGRTRRGKPYGINGVSKGARIAQLRSAEKRGLLQRHRLAGSMHCLYKVRGAR